MAITLHRINDTTTKEYQFVENLLTQAFPKEEYRELPAFRTLTRDKEIFHNNLIHDDNTLVGFVTYWDFASFYYIEHFAILPEMRNHSYGKQVLAYLKEQLHGPIVLEAECPVEELAQRRIGFYKRQGFTLWQQDYMQPPYRPGDGFLKLMLMAYGNLREDKDFDLIKKTIHREVYGFLS